MRDNGEDLRIAALEMRMRLFLATKRVEQVLAERPEVAPQIETLTQLITLLRMVPRPEPPEEMWDRVMRDLRHLFIQQTAQPTLYRDLIGWMGRYERSCEAAREAFEALVTRHRRFIYSIARARASDPQSSEEIEDLVRDVLAEALGKFHLYTPGTRFDLWIVTMVKNRMIDAARRRKLVTMVSFERTDRDEDMGEMELPSPDPSPEALLTDSMLDETIQAALDALPDEYRLAVELVDLQDLNYEEAAELLECPVGTIRSRLHRGRTAIRKHLEAAGHAVPGAADD